ncbi:MAG: PIN domain-containing protein [Verrucomicrobia bacterium]|nr:PIN domain-containing protein [Verrucomicrobiota bacterium]
MEILVDSTHYISLLRKGLDPRYKLAGWAASGRLHGCGVIRAEVLRGCRHPDVKADLCAFFDLLPESVLDPNFWREVSELAWRLDRKGTVLPLTDLVIATIATRLNAAVISTDPHFHAVPGLQVLAEVPRLG